MPALIIGVIYVFVWLIIGVDSGADALLNSHGFQTFIFNFHLPKFLAFACAYYLALDFLFTHTSNITTSLKAPVITVFKYLEKLKIEEVQWVVIYLLITTAIAHYIFYDGISRGARDIWEMYNFKAEQKGFFGQLFEMIAFFISFFSAIPTLLASGILFLYTFLTVPFCIFASVVYTHYLFIRHPLAPYVKSNKPIPARVMRKVEKMGGQVGSGRVAPAFVYENYRIKTEKLFTDIREKEELRQRQEQAQRDRKTRGEELKIEQQQAQRQQKEISKVKLKMEEEKAQYGTKEQQERRAAFSQAQADLVNSFVETKGDHNDKK